MTVVTSHDSDTHIGNGLTTKFPFTFKIFEPENLSVVVSDTSAVITLLAVHTDYSVVYTESGGEITLRSPLTNGYTIVIARELDVVQSTSFRNQGRFFPHIHENAFDYLTMLIQQCLSMFKRCLRYPRGGVHYEAEGRRIVNLQDPVENQDAATKKFVQDEDANLKQYIDDQDKILDDKINEVGNTNIGRIMAQYPEMNAIKKTGLDLNDPNLPSGLYEVLDDTIIEDAYVPSWLLSDKSKKETEQSPIKIERMSGMFVFHQNGNDMDMGDLPGWWEGNSSVRLAKQTLILPFIDEHSLSNFVGYESSIYQKMRYSTPLTFTRIRTIRKNVLFGEGDFDWGSWDGMTYDPSMPLYEYPYWDQWQIHLDNSILYEIIKDDVKAEANPTIFSASNYLSSFSQAPISGLKWADANTYGKPTDPAFADSRYLVRSDFIQNLNQSDSNPTGKDYTVQYMYVTEVPLYGSTTIQERKEQPRTWIGVYQAGYTTPFFWYRTDTIEINETDVLKVMRKYGYASTNVANILAYNNNGGSSGKPMQILDFADPLRDFFGGISPLLSGNYIAFSTALNAPLNATPGYHFQVTVKPTYPTPNSGSNIRDYSIYDVIEVPPISSVNPRPHTGKRWTGLFSKIAAGNKYQVNWIETTSSGGNDSGTGKLVRKEKILNGLVKNGTYGVFQIPDSINSVEITGCGAGGGGGNKYISTFSDGQYARAGQQATAFIDLKVMLQEGFRYVIYKIPTGAYPGTDGGDLEIHFMNTDDESQLKAVNHDVIICRGGVGGDWDADTFINTTGRNSLPLRPAVYYNTQLDESKSINTYGTGGILIKSPVEISGVKYNTTPLGITGISDTRYGQGGNGRGPTNSTGAYGSDGYLKISWYEIE